MIYLDNAATSFPKPERVSMEMARCMRQYCANPGRGGHYLSMEAGRAVTKAREVIGSFFNIKDPMQLCFTKKCNRGFEYRHQGRPGTGSACNHNLHGA